jgi:hypothetical protein
MALLDLSEIMQRWLVARGVELPTEPVPAPEVPAGEQLALPLAWDGPDRGIEYIPLAAPLRIRRGRRPVSVVRGQLSVARRKAR